MSRIGISLAQLAILLAVFVASWAAGGSSNAIAAENDKPTDLFLGIKPDAATGYEAITTLMRDSSARAAFTVADIDRLWMIWEDDERAKAENATPAEKRRMTFERYGWVMRPGDETPSVPFGYTERADGGLVMNCFACHGGKVAGKTMPGVGNTHVDQTALFIDVQRLHALDAGKDPSKVQEKLPFGIVANYHKGFTNAVIFEVVDWVFANPDVTLRVMAKPDTLLHHDINPPAWWTTKKKARLYTDGFAPKTPRQNMPFARGRGNSKDWEEKWHALEPTFVHIYEYIEKLESPKYPYEINEGLAKKGRELFNQTCSRCHGTYGEGGEYPNEIVDIDDVGTDPVRLHAVSKENREWGNKTWLQYDGKQPLWLESKGYLAPPLDGVWASAPYFHNGAAPTLTAVMNPKERPKVWKRTEDGYDKRNVGLEVEVFDAVPEGLSSRVRRMYYDTSHVGNSAAGHNYPDELNADEKLAVIEYLKTL